MILLAFATAVNSATKTIQLDTPTELKMSPFSPYTFTWNPVKDATSYRIIISKVNSNGEYFLGFNPNKMTCDATCVTFKIKTTTGSYNPPQTAVNFIASQGVFGLGITIRAGNNKPINKESAWFDFHPQSHIANTPFVNSSNDDTLMLNIESSFVSALGSKTNDDSLYTGLALIMKSMTKVAPKAAETLLKPTSINAISREIINSNLLVKMVKDKKSLYTSLPTFLADVVVDAATNFLKNNYPDKTEGQVMAWEIKASYLASKSAIIGATNPFAGGVEFVVGGTQLNIEIWGRVGEAIGDAWSEKVKQSRAEAYVDIMDQTTKFMKRYSSGNQAVKNETLGWLTEVFDSIRPSLHPNTPEPFFEYELNAMETLSKSTILNFNQAKFKLYKSLLLKDSAKARTFLNDYFTDDERSALLELVS